MPVIPVNRVVDPKRIIGKRRTEQGCQIFLGTKYQNGKKYTKLPRTIPNVHKI
jgi:hypothetical protein